jgi:hypothetical protein
MAFTNLPPNLKDMFYSLSDRISKLETGPNQAMYTAESAQGSAATASAQAAQAEADAIAAGVQANYAASQATIAQSQATIASTQATAAQASADGKNKVYYSTSTPGSTANQVGDIWYQYGTSGTYANKVIAQWSGAGGTSWTSVTVSGLIIANIDAGSITTGTLSAIQIDAGSGTQKFNVSSTGYLSAQGAYIKGNITADSGTFTGSIRADAGYFGTGTGATLTNGWSITSTGLTGVGTGNITGGLITGTTFQTAASSTRITINASSDNAIKIYPDASLQPGYINASSVSGVGSLRINGPYTSGWNNSNIQLYSLAAGTSYIQLSGDVTSLTGGLTVSAGSIFSGTVQLSSATTYPGVATASGSNLVVVATGSRIGYVSSSRTTKKNIKPIVAGSYMDKLLALEPVAFDWKDQPDDMPYRRNYGLIAEDVAALSNELESIVNYNAEGAPVSISYDRLSTFLLLAVKELQQEINEIRGQ